MSNLPARLVSVLTPGSEGGTSTSLPHVYLLTDSVRNTPGFRAHLSTEMAVVKFLNDLLIASDYGCISILVHLHLSAAFNPKDLKECV